MEEILAYFWETEGCPQKRDLLIMLESKGLTAVTMLKRLTRFGMSLMRRISKELRISVSEGEKILQIFLLQCCIKYYKHSFKGQVSLQENKILRFQKQEAPENQRGKPGLPVGITLRGRRKGNTVVLGTLGVSMFLSVLELEFRLCFNRGLFKDELS